MQIIPVIDLSGGQVVRALRGERATYRPIASALCAGSRPEAVAAALVERCRSGRLYVADIDALLGGAPQVPSVRAIVQALPGVELWLDAGFADRDAARRLLRELHGEGERVVPVYASESLRSLQALEEACARDPQGAVLSLDRRAGSELDAAGCWRTPALWPQRVIVMTLERVGAGSGPDLETLARAQRSKPDARFIGAGGIRDATDARSARAAGAHAWLVASALHDLRLDPAAP